MKKRNQHHWIIFFSHTYCKKTWLFIFLILLLIFFLSLEGLGQINDVIKDATNKLGVLSRLRCLAEVKHFKSVEEDDDGLNSEIVRRTALIQGNIDLDFYTSHLVSITLTEDFLDQEL